MAIRRVEINKYQCGRCGNEWFTKNPESGETPAMCPRCKSRKWNEAGDGVSPSESLGYTGADGKVVITRPESIVMVSDKSNKSVIE